MKENEDIDKIRQEVINARKSAEEVLKELKKQRSGIFSVTEINSEREQKITNIQCKLSWLNYYYGKLVELGGSVSKKGYFKAIDRVSDCAVVFMPEGLHVTGNMYVSQNELNPPFVIPNIGLASELVGKLYDYYCEELKNAAKNLSESWN